MPLLGADDLRAAIAALGGVEVTIGSTTVLGLLRKPDVEMLQTGETNLIGRAVTVLVVTDDLPGLSVGASITVDGEAMKVNRHLAESDGSVTRLLCTKA